MVSLGTLLGTVEVGLKLNAISDVLPASEFRVLNEILLCRQLLMFVLFNQQTFLHEFLPG